MRTGNKAYKPNRPFSPIKLKKQYNNEKNNTYCIIGYGPVLWLCG